MNKKYQMNLHNNPFILIKNGLKTIEMRLNDDRRKEIESGDFIEFTNRDTNERMLVSVLSVKTFKDFHELYQNYDKRSLGYKTEEIADPNDMLLYYSSDSIEQYGALAIEIKRIQ